MKYGPFSARWFPGDGGFVRLGDWSLALFFDAFDRDFVPLSERYGTTRTWRVGPLRIRRHGHLYRRYL